MADDFSEKVLVVKAKSSNYDLFYVFACYFSMMPTGVAKLLCFLLPSERRSLRAKRPLVLRERFRREER